MKSEVINIKTPVSRVGNKTAILHILYALFPLHYGRFIQEDYHQTPQEFCEDYYAEDPTIGGIL